MDAVEVSAGTDYSRGLQKTGNNARACVASCDAAQASPLLPRDAMSRDVRETQAAVYDLHKEWRELTALRLKIQEGPHDDAAERNLLARLERHREKLQALRSAMIAELEDELLAAGPAGGTPFLAHN